MMEGSEPVKSNRPVTKRPALRALKEWNKVEHPQNAAGPACVLIIRRSLVRILAVVAISRITGKPEIIHNFLHRFRSFVLVLQIMDGAYQFSKRARPDGIFAILEISNGTFGNSGLARKELSGELFCFFANRVEIIRVYDSFVPAECFMCRVPEFPLQPSWTDQDRSPNA
jgi:hypothetical protein